MAVYFLDADALFIHFPKTGGTWVENASRRAGIRVARLPPRTSGTEHKHLTRDRYGCKGAFTWTVVRRPDDWYISWYRYASLRAWPRYEHHDAHPQSCLAECAADTFEQFIELCLRRHPGYLSQMYARYTAGLEFVGTMENLPRDLRKALQPRIEVPELDPEPVHATVGPRPQWPSELRQRLLDCEAGAMKIWQQAHDGPWDAKLGGPRAA